MIDNIDILHRFAGHGVDFNGLIVPGRAISIFFRIGAAGSVQTKLPKKTR